MSLDQVISFIKRKKPSRILTQRIFKCTVNSTIALILCLNPTTLSHLGGEPAMLPLLSVMVHPGRRLGTMIEAVFFCTTGLLIGNSYALLGRFVAQRIVGSQYSGLTDRELFSANYTNYRAALVILALFEMGMLFFHGWMRSITHKFFGIVFPLFLVVHFTFTDNITTSAGTIVRNFTVPFFMGIALSLACNLVIFPEFGSSYLGKSIIDTLNELHFSLDDTVQFFITMKSGDSLDYKRSSLGLAPIVKKKTSLRSKLNSTQVVLQECSYEISYSYLSPVELKPIIEILKEELSYVNALINASQLQFTSLLEGEESQLLSKVMERTRDPIYKLQKQISQSLYLAKTVIGHSYDVNSSLILESNNLALEPINLESVNFEAEVLNLAKSMAQFEITFRAELRNLSSGYDAYLSPNTVMFLLSSFLMNMRESANSVANILKESHRLYEIRKVREKKGILGRRIWFSFLTSTDQLKGWFNANSYSLVNANEIASLNGDNTSKVFVTEESVLSKPLIVSGSKMDNILIKISSFYNHFKPHFRFGFQITVGLMVASFPMFLPESRNWYSEYRGSWIAFVCILVLEPEVGSTFFVFFLRGVGVISGAAWGYLSYVAAVNQTNPYLETVITAIGAIPGFYFFLGTPYVKAAIIGIISIYIVLLSTVIPSEVGGSILVNFAKRCLAMIYGGVIALFCQLIFFPIKARDELIKEVAFSSGAISKLLLLYASGLEGEDVKLSLSQKRFDAFKKLSAQAKSSLIKADSFRASAKKEPRLKGSFEDIEKIFYEITFILREILDRLDNIVQLRRSYGSAIIEEFNNEVHMYRRQLSASMSNSLKAIQLALLTKSPLPQYLPSPKISQKRLIEKVRETVQKRFHTNKPNESDSDSDSEVVINFNKRGNKQREDLLKTKFLSWNATTAATEEIIQYIEELIELGKVLVGVHEFKYGFLSRSLYSDYAAKAARGFSSTLSHSANEPAIDDVIDDSSIEEGDIEPVALVDNGISDGFRKRVYSIGSFINDAASTKSFGDITDEEIELPLSLMRVVTKKAKEED